MHACATDAVKLKGIIVFHFDVYNVHSFLNDQVTQLLNWFFCSISLLNYKIGGLAVIIGYTMYSIVCNIMHFFISVLLCLIKTKEYESNPDMH